jgi:hypothetical protein
VPTRTRRKKSKPKPERCEPRRRETHHTHRNLSGANLDRVVRRADAAHRTTIGTGYMMNKGDWIWRVGKAVSSWSVSRRLDQTMFDEKISPYRILN